MEQPAADFDLKTFLNDELKRLEAELKEFGEREDLWEARRKFREIFTQIFKSSEFFGMTVDSIDKFQAVCKAFKSIGEEALAELEKLGIDILLEDQFVELENRIKQIKSDLKRLEQEEN